MTAKMKSRRGAPSARILGVGGYRPTRVVTNEEILQSIDSSDEWIRTRSGIVTRHWAGPEETVAEMALAAAGKALASAGISAEAIDVVIISTVSHFKQTPSIATEIAHRIGAGKPAAFDISAACAGFVYGVNLARDMIEGGLQARITCVDPRKLDRSFAGRTFDAKLLADLPDSVDPCGENGEFHSFAFDGPMFHHPIPIEVGEIVDRDNFVFADLVIGQPVSGKTAE